MFGGLGWSELEFKLIYFAALDEILLISAQKVWQQRLYVMILLRLYLPRDMIWI